MYQLNCLQIHSLPGLVELPPGLHTEENPVIILIQNKKSGFIEHLEVHYTECQEAATLRQCMTAIQPNEIHSIPVYMGQCTRPTASRWCLPVYSCKYLYFRITCTACMSKLTCDWLASNRSAHNTTNFILTAVIIFLKSFWSEWPINDLNETFYGWCRPFVLSNSTILI
jgi:hypothetical protein